MQGWHLRCAGLSAHRPDVVSNGGLGRDLAGILRLRSARRGGVRIFVDICLLLLLLRDTSRAAAAALLGWKIGELEAAAVGHQHEPEVRHVDVVAVLALRSSLAASL